MFKISLPIYHTLKPTKKKPRPKQFLLSSNWFRNAHFHVKNDVKTHYHKLIALKVRGIESIDEPYTTKYVYYYKNKGSDGSNVVSLVEKFLLDGLQEAGIVPEDNVLFHSSDGFRCVEDKKNPRVEIEVYVNEEN